jgi:nitrite reductase (cytochrome c-552)
MVMAGFRHVSRQSYSEVLSEVLRTPDGTPHARKPSLEAAEPEEGVTVIDPGGSIAAAEVDHAQAVEAHPVSCIDCHDPETMQIRVTRPGFVVGIRALAESGAPVPHLPSIERWRESGSEQPYAPNRDASRQEMRSLVCGQCHVEYYCANKMTLTFPWGNGLEAAQIEQFWEQTTFDDGTDFFDYKHGETGAKTFKAQHPEFELWSQGIHARSGVGCADCHMPYQRIGAMKVSSHWVRSPLLSVNRSCQTCHNVADEELVARVENIQSRTRSIMDRAAKAMTEMLDAIGATQAAGVPDEQLKPIFDLQRKSMWRLDYISSENSLGFHADQQAVSLLGESIDYSRQAQAAAIRLRAPDPPEPDAEIEPIQGVTPAAESPDRQ